MSVTDKTNPTAGLVKSRNMPYGDRPPREAVYRTEVCGRCFGEIAPDEPVWLRAWCAYWSEYSGRYIHRAYAAACSNCSANLGLRKVRAGFWWDSVTYQYWYEGACETCGRTVFKEARYMRRHFFCCESHRETYWSRQRRKAKPEKACEVCGEVFTATRSDAKTCSPACKQKAYRRRRASA